MGNFGDELIKIQGKLMRQARLLTGDDDKAKDLRQETLLRILNNADKYRRDENFEAWAFTVMKNLFKNDVRGKGEGRRMFVDGYDVNLYNNSCEVNDTENIYIAKEVMEQISLLSPAQSQLIEMRIAGYRYDEIACEMNLPLGCVKSSLHRAKKELRKRLDN